MNFTSMIDDNTSSGSPAVTTSVIFQPFKKAMTKPNNMVETFETAIPRTSATAPRTAGASVASLEVSAPDVLASMSNHPTSMRSTACRNISRTRVARFDPTKPKQ